MRGRLGGRGPRPALLAAVAALLLGAPAEASPPRLKRARVSLAGGQVAVSVGFRDLFDARLRRGLRSGFPTRVVMRVAVYPEGGDTPVAVSARALAASYDIWSETFTIEIDDILGHRRRTTRAAERVLDVLSSLYRYPVARASDLTPGRPYFVAIDVQVNPVSERLLADVRRWLRRPPTLRRSAGDSLFGAFVSIFVNERVRGAERAFRVRTQPFYLPGP